MIFTKILNFKLVLRKVSFQRFHSRQLTELKGHPTRLHLSHLLSLAFCLMLQFPVQSQALKLKGDLETSIRQIAPGITLQQEITTGASHLVVSILRVDMKRKSVRVESGQANDEISLNGKFEGRETVAEIAKRSGAIAVVNADFFPYTGDPLGLEIHKGELLSETMNYRACLGISHGKIRIAVLTTLGFWTTQKGEGRVHGINRLPASGEITLLTPSFRAEIPAPRTLTLISLSDLQLPVRLSHSFEGLLGEKLLIVKGAKLPKMIKSGGFLAIGEEVQTPLRNASLRNAIISMTFHLIDSGEPLEDGKMQTLSDFIVRKHSIIWGDVKEAISGGPWLVKHGRLFVDGEAEKFDLLNFIEARHPRTAVGVTSKQELLLVAVDGRAPWSQGASLPEMAEIMLRLNVEDAINLDGGGSTSLVVKDQYINAPSDGKARPVADCLLIFSGKARSPEMKKETERTLVSVEQTIRVGETISLVSRIDPAQSRYALWGTDEGFGFVNQSGEFMSAKQGRGRVFALIDKRKFVFPVTVTP